MKKLTPLIAAICLAPAAVASETFVEEFEAFSNVGGWNWGTGNEGFSPLNGHPGAFLWDLTLISCCPSAFTSPGVESEFTGNYREREVTSVGVDLITLDTTFGIGTRPLTVMLTSDNGTPFDFDDDRVVYYVGDKDIPDPGVPGLTPPGWADYDFTIPSDSPTLPDEWLAFGLPGETPDEIWNAVIEDVDILEFYYGEPGVIFLVLSWDVGMDNARITTGQPCPSDVDGSGVVDVQDLVSVIVAWGTSDAAADVDGDGLVGVQDLVAVIIAWGECA